MRRDAPAYPLIAWIPAVLLLASCATLEPKRDGVPDEYTPAEFSTVGGTAERQTPWWKGFGSAQLDRLMEQAFAGSLTLEQAAARLQQAEATARKSGAVGRLQLDAEAAASSKYTSDENGHYTTPAITAGLYASYEVDPWGRLKSAERASIANMEASRFDVQTAAMSLAGEVAQSYFGWLSKNQTLALYESQLASNRKKLSAMEQRFKTGQASALDVLQQRQLVAAAEAKLPPVRSQIKTYEHNLAILTGQIPGTDLRLAPESLPALPPRPATGLPVNLLENRPDIQSARLDLESADWNIAAARAARLPTLSLTGSVYTKDEQIDKLFNDWVSNLAAGLVAPLLDGGARKAEVDRTLAVAREQIAAYRLAVLKAVQETEDALNSEQQQSGYVDAIGKQLAAARKSETESIRRYQRGLLPFLDTLTAIVARETLEITLLQARADLLTDRIQLYRALGGDWTFILEDNQ